MCYWLFVAVKLVEICKEIGVKTSFNLTGIYVS